MCIWIMLFSIWCTINYNPKRLDTFHLRTQVEVCHIHIYITMPWFKWIILLCGANSMKCISSKCSDILFTSSHPTIGSISLFTISIISWASLPMQKRKVICKQICQKFSRHKYNITDIKQKQQRANIWHQSNTTSIRIYHCHNEHTAFYC